MGITGLCEDIVSHASRISYLFFTTIPALSYNIYVDALYVSCNESHFDELENVVSQLLLRPGIHVNLWFVFDNFWTLKDLATKAVCGHESKRPQLHYRNMLFMSEKMSLLAGRLASHAAGYVCVHWCKDSRNADLETANLFAFPSSPIDVVKILFSSDGDVLLQSLLNLASVSQPSFNPPLAFVSVSRGRRIEILSFPEGDLAASVLECVARGRAIDTRFLELYAGATSTNPEYDRIEQEMWLLLNPECPIDPRTYFSPHMTDLDMGFETIHHALSQGQTDYSERYWEACLATLVENIYWGVSSSEEEVEILRRHRQMRKVLRDSSLCHHSEYVPEFASSSVPVSRITNIPPEFCYNAGELSMQRILDAITHYHKIIQYVSRCSGRFPPGTKMCTVKSTVGNYMFFRLEKGDDCAIGNLPAFTAKMLGDDEHARSIIQEHLAICRSLRDEIVSSRMSGCGKPTSQGLGFYMDGYLLGSQRNCSRIFDGCAIACRMYMAETSRCRLASSVATPAMGRVDIWEYY